MNSPFRYPGGKSYAKKIIIDLFPEHTKYCEPFVGGGSIFFNKPKTWTVLNDLDEDLINCYFDISCRCEELIIMLKAVSPCKELHNYYKNIYKPKDQLEKSFKYLFLNRISYSGIMNKQNCYFGYDERYSKKYENWPEMLRKVSSYLDGIVLLSKDFRIILNDLDDSEYFMFIDPPYYNTDQSLIYTNSFKKKDHEDLYEILKHADFKFLLSYDNCDYIRDLYKDFNMQYGSWNYKMNRSDDQKNEKYNKDGFKSERKNCKELLIMNY